METHPWKAKAKEYRDQDRIHCHLLDSIARPIQAHNSWPAIAACWVPCGPAHGYLPLVGSTSQRRARWHPRIFPHRVYGERRLQTGLRLSI